MDKKPAAKPEQKESNYVETIRDGAVAANIFRGQSNDGFRYHYFRLSRSWKSTKQNTEGYSDRFFSRNTSGIEAVARQAAERCEQLDEPLQSQVDQPSTELMV